MTITVHTVGRFKEVVFRDAEHDDVRARSGLLDEDEAKELAERLRDVSQALSQTEPIDENQTVLPFETVEMRGRLAREHSWSDNQAAMGY